MTREEKVKKEIKELRESADRMEASVSGNAGPSSQEWVSPERRAHYYEMADERRRKADILEKELNEGLIEPRTAKGSLD